MSEPSPKPERRPGPLTATGSFLYRDLLLRVLLIVLVVGSVLLIWWSLWRLTPLQERSRTLNTTITRLQAEVDLMEGTWSQSRVQQVVEQFNQIQGHLFVGQSALDTWFQGLKEQVVPMALDVKANFGKAGIQETGGQKLAVVPTTVSVDIKPAPGILSAQTPYQRLLLLSQRLTTQERRADMVELTVSSGSNSVNRAAAVLNMWAGEEAAQ